MSSSKWFIVLNSRVEQGLGLQVWGLQKPFSYQPMSSDPLEAPRAFIPLQALVEGNSLTLPFLGTLQDWGSLLSTVDDPFPILQCPS